MKKITKRILIFLLMACMILPYTSTITAHAISTQESYYLSMLNPSSAKGRSESYPVKLSFKAPNSYTDATELLEFHGTLSVNTGISDEDMLSILEDALSSVSGYEELQDAVDDKVLAEQSLEKLKVSQEDIDKMIENWQKLLGIDNVVTLLSGNLPNIGTSDAINAVIDGAQGNVPGLPGVPGIGNVIDTVFISYEQWEKDKEKYKDIVNAYNANRRLDAYYVRVSELMQEQRAEESSWTLKINEQKTASFEFLKIEGNTQIWTTDIELKKTDGSYGNVSGIYEGRFCLNMDCDLSTFDSSIARDLAEWNSRDDTEKLDERLTFIRELFYSPYRGTSWSVIDESGSASSFYSSFEIPDCEMDLTLPIGVSRAFFEISIDSSVVYLTDYSVSIDRQFTLRGSSGAQKPIVHSYTIKSKDDMHYLTYTEHGDTVVTFEYERKNAFYFDEDLDMTLIIDMLGN